jgi:DNA transformation protein and related proteins
MRGAGSESEYVAYVVDLLSGWAPVAPRRMFSGHGLYRGEIMFALVTGDVLYFKTDALNRGEYEAAGMAPFSYARAGREAVIMSYHAVPPDLLESDGELAVWAERAFAAALRARRTKTAPPQRAATRPGKRK